MINVNIMSVYICMCVCVCVRGSEYMKGIFVFVIEGYEVNKLCVLCKNTFLCYLLYHILFHIKIM